jgi:hypothetical protein
VLVASAAMVPQCTILDAGSAAQKMVGAAIRIGATNGNINNTLQADMVWAGLRPRGGEDRPGDHFIVRCTIEVEGLYAIKTSSERRTLCEFFHL